LKPSKKDKPGDTRESSHGLKQTPPWGQWEVLREEEKFKVKRIEIKPGHRLSYQKHFRRREHWMVVMGKAIVTLDGKDYELEEGMSINIPMHSAHRIANPGDEPLVFIEVQQGDYFGEDDVIRLEDDYGRA
jgi:mannose-6-phosphate isomerase-like protein (cupin superfamily)